MALVVVKLWLKATFTVPLFEAGLLTVITWQPMVSVYVALLAEQPFASTTCTVIGKLPVCVGVPERTPAADSVRPTGSVPLLSENVFAPIAAGAVKLWLKAMLTMPVFVAGLLTVMVWQLIVSEYVAPLPKQPFASVALTTIGNVPVCVGVPERTPADDSVRPAGSVEAVENVTAPIVLPAVKTWLKAAAAMPVLVAGLVTVMVWQAMVSVYAGPIPVQPWPSVTLTVIGKLPVCVGVPERTPAVESVRPAGSAPLLIVNVAPPMAPLWVKFWLNAVFAVPVVVAGVVTVTRWELMISAYVGPTPVRPPASGNFDVMRDGALP